MKYKILITTILAGMVTSAYSEPDKYYLKLGAGINSIYPFDVNDGDLRGRVKLNQQFPLVEIGFGQQLNDYIRSDLTFDYYFMFKSNENGKHGAGIYDITTKTKVNGLYYNVYADILKSDKINIFLGGGAGISFQKEKAQGYVVVDDIHNPLLQTSSKHVKRFSYKGTVGISFKYHDNVTTELSYNYFSLGKNKPRMIDGEQNLRKRNYKVHNLTLGIRYEL